jgi:uncharacterized membrane protein YedE/YeeE
MEFSVWVVMSGLLLIGMTAGFLMHRSDFCMAGAFRDVFLFRSYRLIRPIVLLISLSALLFELCHITGVLPIYPFPWFAPPAGVNIFGGMVFGLGMVMAGGCVVGVLYKMGAGNLLALVAFLGLLAGSALYAEIHSWWAPLSRLTVFPTRAVTLPQWIGGSSTVLIFVCVTISGVCCWRWKRGGHWINRNAAEGYIPLWFTATGLAMLGVLTVLLCGMPMGVTTSYAKGAAFLESWLAPGHLANLAYFTTTPMQSVLPLDGVLRSGGAGPHFDIVMMVQAPLILGIVGGSWLSAQLLNEFRIVWKVPCHQAAMAFAGGVIMALGSRLSPGCNVWHLWGGLPLLTMQSLLFVIGLLPGAWLGGKILQRVLLSAAAPKRLNS